jgi:MSHA biogenesis protein MshL
MRKFILISSLAMFTFLTACAENEPKPFVPSEGHINAETPPEGNIPELVTQAPTLLPPAPAAQLEKYTVVVNEVPVKELLFALARDAQVNVDIDPKIEGVVTINAIDQTLPQILDRIARQVNLRYEFSGNNLQIEPDQPYLQTYKVNYINLERTTDVENTISTKIGSTATSPDTGGSSSSSSSSSSSGSSGGGASKSSTSVESSARNYFWESLVNNVFAIIGDEQESGGSGLARSVNVLPSPESGLLTVRATAGQHKYIQQLIDALITSARRQVMIQATIVEVQLDDVYEAGIDWESIDLGTGFSIAVNTLTGGAGAAAGVTGLAVGAINATTGGVATYRDDNASGRTISATIQLLNEFGNVSVLSSPQLMTLNNQTALLKVVNNEVYFTVKTDTITSSVSPTTSFSTSTPHVIPVGIVMSLTPYIDEDDQVILQARPTISRLFGTGVEDPVNPGNFIPEVQVREMESVLRLNDGQIGVLGGLMQDSSTQSGSQLPGTKSVSFFARLFGSTRKDYTKSELVILLRPIIVREPSLEGDLSGYKQYLNAYRESTAQPAGSEAK